MSGQTQNLTCWNCIVTQMRICNCHVREVVTWLDWMEHGLKWKQHFNQHCRFALWTLSEPREHMQQGTQVSNVQWISTTILPVYSCCYYYRSLVSIEYPDRRLWRHDPWKLRTDTRYDQSTNTSWETYSIKAWEGWDPNQDQETNASQANTSPDTRSGDFFFRLFFWFFAHGGWEETKVHYGDLLRSGTSLFFCWFTMEVEINIFLTFEGMFSVIVWVTHAGSDWPRV